MPNLNVVKPLKNRRWLPSTAVLAIVAPILGICIARWEYDLTSWFSSLDLPGDFNKALHLSEAFAHGSGVIAIFLILLVVDNSRRKQICSMILMVVVSMSIANSCKLIISRARPNSFNAGETIVDTWLAKSDRKGYDTRIRSFPSGHSATAAAMAFALTALYPRGKYVFAFLAVLACLQRIASRSHYPTDVLAGVTIAAIVALIWHRLFPGSFFEKNEWETVTMHSGSPIQTQVGHRGDTSKT